MNRVQLRYIQQLQYCKCKQMKMEITPSVKSILGSMLSMLLISKNMVRIDLVAIHAEGTLPGFMTDTLNAPGAIKGKITFQDPYGTDSVLVLCFNDSAHLSHRQSTACIPCLLKWLYSHKKCNMLI
jgi:hypothetical protein